MCICIICYRTCKCCNWKCFFNHTFSSRIILTRHIDFFVAFLPFRRCQQRATVTVRAQVTSETPKAMHLVYIFGWLLVLSSLEWLLYVKLNTNNDRKIKIITKREPLRGIKRRRKKIHRKIIESTMRCRRNEHPTSSAYPVRFGSCDLTSSVLHKCVHSFFCNLCFFSCQSFRLHVEQIDNRTDEKERGREQKALTHTSHSKSSTLFRFVFLGVITNYCDVITQI